MSPHDRVAMRLRLLSDLDVLRLERPIDKRAVLMRLHVLRGLQRLDEMSGVPT